MWWSQTGSNRRPPACKAGALPAELWPRNLSFLLLASLVARSVGHVHLCTLPPSLAIRLASNKKSCVTTFATQPAVTPGSPPNPDSSFIFRESRRKRPKSSSLNEDASNANSRKMVGLGRFELPTSPLSGVRSNQLSYRPLLVFFVHRVVGCSLAAVMYSFAHSLARSQAALR
jgi:hypothetical protein